MKLYILFFFCIFNLQMLFADLLYDIVDGKFKSALVQQPYPLQDGNSYVLLVDNKAIVSYSYATGNYIDTLFSLSRIKDCPIKEIQGFELSPNDSKLLLYTNVNKRYRRSFTADYYVYDFRRKDFLSLSDNGQQESPLFSPNSRYVAFGRNNNLFLKKLDYNTETSITTDGKLGGIINGISDFLYEEEFKKTRYYEWSPDSKKLVFLKFDETNVENFSYQLYRWKNISFDELSQNPSIITMKYPMSGQVNPRVSLCVFDEVSKATRSVLLGKNEEDYYLPYMKWSKSPDHIAVFKLSRNQKRMELLMVDVKSTLSQLILVEEDDNYVDFQNSHWINFTNDQKYFMTVSERDGYRHIYQYHINGTFMKQLTKGNWDVTKVYGYDQINQILYFQSAETSPMQRDVYALNAKGKKTRITDGKGIHDATFNTTFSYFFHEHSSLGKPNHFQLSSVVGKGVKVLETNAFLTERMQLLSGIKKEFFSFTSKDNMKLNGWIVKPNILDPTKKYPLLLVQYSGTNSQEVLDKWDIGWEYYLATQGVVVACVDGRGTGARGAVFRKSTTGQLGVLEAKDQLSAANYLGTLPFIDKNQIGIWGWSYGGFVSLSAMTQGDEPVFKFGVAVAPVSDWRMYNTAYTERLMRRPQENYKGYEVSSTLLNAKKLQGNLLIVHGTADDNVHVQNTMQLVDQLVKADKQFEMQLYTDVNHSFTNPQAKRHLYRRMSNFILQNAKTISR